MYKIPHPHPHRLIDWCTVLRMRMRTRRWGWVRVLVWFASDYIYISTPCIYIYSPSTKGVYTVVSTVERITSDQSEDQKN